MSKRMLRSVRFVLVLAALLLLAMAPPVISADIGPVCYTRILLSSDVTSSGGIIRGPDNNIWVFEQTTGNSFRLARLTADLEFAEFPIPGTPIQMTAGPDGNIWFTRYDVGALTRVTVAGSATTFPLPAQYSSPSGIVVGPDGKLWVTETASHQILKVGTDGAVLDHFAISTTDGYPSLIIRGPDNNLWFLEDTQKIGRMTTAGVLAEFPFASAIIDLAAGPDGNIWFDRFESMPSPYDSSCYFGKILSSGTTTEFIVWGCSFDMTSGSDGNLWTIHPSGRGYSIGRFTPAGTVGTLSAYGDIVYIGPDINTTNIGFWWYPTGIASGADGRIWISEELWLANGGSMGTVAFINPQHLDCYYQNLPALNK